MRRDRAWQRGRALWIIAAGGIGYLIGGWQAATLSKLDLSPAQAVALRFPEDQGLAADAAAADATAAADTMVLGDRQFALLSPTPMAPFAQSQPVRVAAAEEGALPPLPEPASPRHASAAIQTAAAAKAPVVPAHRRTDQRLGFMLNDAQIASIKDRLHLTPDQERMWPGVEAALRNIAYAKARRHGAPAAGTAELASLSPESVEVQDLKSAAIPLIMSFSDEQKDEVRSLAHVMGLDQLATAF